MDLGPVETEVKVKKTGGWSAAQWRRYGDRLYLEHLLTTASLPAMAAMSPRFRLRPMMLVNGAGGGGSGPFPMRGRVRR